jgi:hypothetical protein
MSEKYKGFAVESQPAMQNSLGQNAFFCDIVFVLWLVAMSLLNESAKPIRGWLEIGKVDGQQT